MADLKVRINTKTSTGYDTLHPETKGDIVLFDKNGSNLSATNTDNAIKEVNTKTDLKLDKNKVVNNLVSTDINLALSAPMGKQLKEDIDNSNKEIKNKIVIGNDKNTTLIVTNQVANFANGLAEVRMNETASAYNKTIKNVIAQLQSGSNIVITSVTTSNNIVTIRCSNLTGTPFSGKILTTLLLFMS